MTDCLLMTFIHTSLWSPAQTAAPSSSLLSSAGGWETETGQGVGAGSSELLLRCIRRGAPRGWASGCGSISKAGAVGKITLIPYVDEACRPHGIIVSTHVGLECEQHVTLFWKHFIQAENYEFALCHVSRMHRRPGERNTVFAACETQKPHRGRGSHLSQHRVWKELCLVN